MALNRFLNSLKLSWNERNLKWGTLLAFLVVVLLVLGYITRQQAGTILVLIGTVVMAFTLNVKKQYNDELKELVEKHKNLIQITDVTVLCGKIKICLSFIIIGTLLQFPMT